MADNRGRYKQLEQFLTMLLLLNLVIFVIYLICAGFGILALKIIAAIAVVLICAFCLWMLHSSKEMFRTRSLWLTCAFASLLLLTIVSLICNYPAP